MIQEIKRENGASINLATGTAINNGTVAGYPYEWTTTTNFPTNHTVLTNEKKILIYSINNNHIDYVILDKMTKDIKEVTFKYTKSLKDIFDKFYGKEF